LLRTRGALRVAIEAASSKKAELAKRHASLEAAAEHVARAQERLRLATAAVAKAKEEHTARVTRALEENREPPRSTIVQDARNMEAETLGELNAAKAAVEAIATGVKDLEVDVTVAGRAVNAALAQTLEPTLRRLIEEARAHRDAYLRAQVAMVAVAGLFDTWRPLRKQSTFIGLGSDADGRVMDAARRQWETALAALRLDPDAELPAIEGD
jgi:hypothetical protein